MPTGYTAPVEDGEITELKDFAANCARAFGAFVHQRDSTGRTLTYPSPPSDDSYYVEALARAGAKMAEWPTLSEEEKYARWSDEVRRIEQDREDSVREYVEKNARYDAMLAQVEAVAVPEELRNFKDFMVQQLTDSKYTDSSSYYTTQDFYEWCDAQYPRFVKDVSYYSDQLAKELERYRERVEYINLMRDTYGFEVETV